MSTLVATNLKHNASASNNIVLDTSGNAAVAANLSFNSGYGSSAVAYGCRAWVNFNGTGTVAIRASGNVSSITDNGGGDFTVNLTTAMPDTNYGIVAGGSQDNNTTTNDRFTSAYVQSSSAVRVIFSAWINGNNRIDPVTCCIAVFR
jgi:hypothetical protein